MNPTPLFFSRNTTAQIVGPESAALLSAIDHEVLAYGRDWQMRDEQVFTAGGCERIADELETRGQPAGAERLRTALRNAQAAALAQPVAEQLALAGGIDPTDAMLEAANTAAQRVRREERSPFDGQE